MAFSIVDGERPATNLTKEHGGHEEEAFDPLKHLYGTTRLGGLFSSSSLIDRKRTIVHSKEDGIIDGEATPYITPNIES